LEKIKKTKLSLWSLIKEGEIISFEDDTITVEFQNGRNFHKKQAEKKENLTLIRKVLEKIYGQSFKLKFELNPEKMVPSGNQDDSNYSAIGRSGSGGKDQLNLSEAAKKDPLIKNIMDTFDGELI